MKIEVHLHGGLVRYVPSAPRGVVRRELPAGSRVADVLASFDFPPERRVIVGINGQKAGLDDALTDGARVDLVPPITGGEHRERTL